MCRSCSLVLLFLFTIHTFVHILSSTALSALIQALANLLYVKTRVMLQWLSLLSKAWFAVTGYGSTRLLCSGLDPFCLPLSGHCVAVVLHLIQKRRCISLPIAWVQFLIHPHRKGVLFCFCGSLKVFTHLAM